MRERADLPWVDVFPEGEAAIGSQLVQLGAAVRIGGLEPQCIVERGQRGRVGVLRSRAYRYRAQGGGPDVRPLRHAAIVSQLVQLTAVGGSQAFEPQCIVENGHIYRV